MSYRSDHDAALARIDALESELARSRSPEGLTAARVELVRLEAEINRRRAQLDRLDRDVVRAPTPSRFLGARLAVAAVVLTGLFWGVRASVGSDADSPEPALPSRPIHAMPASPPADMPAVPPSAAMRLAWCARDLDSAIAARTASSESCIEQIRVASNDPTLGYDVHKLLERWLTIEEAIVRSAPPFDARASLAPTIHAVITPDFMR
jgi:hypothetical protein